MAEKSWVGRWSLVGESRWRAAHCRCESLRVVFGLSGLLLVARWRRTGWEPERERAFQDSMAC